MKVSSIDSKRGIRQEQSGMPSHGGPMPKDSVALASIDIGTRLRIMGFDAVVGPLADVTAGRATHGDLATAVTDVGPNGRIKILPGVYPQAVTFDAPGLVIEGSGHSTNLSGALTLAAGADFSIFRLLRFTGTVTILAGANGNIFSQSFVASPSTISDAGAGSLIDVVSEA